MAEGRVQRRLAAIFAADVVGYSRLMESDEELTRARLRSLKYELIDPRIAADGGRIVKTMGDGVLVEFPSVVDAVRNALAIQGALRQRNADLLRENRIDLRVGINLGDVIIEADDIHGDGVNVAARLEGLCEPGEVYVSGAVYEQADGKLDVWFEDLGEHTVKNIAKPVRVYRAIGAAKADASPAQRPAAAPPITDKPSIAVMPFNNMSGDPEQEYFSDGMAEDLITDISKISGVAVTARNSSFAFKGRAVDLKDVARQLGVKHIVEGSVRKMGDRLRINAQLIDGADGRHVWAERYDGSMENIFEFQDDIREQIVAALRISLTPTDKARTARKQTQSIEAYDLFLKGRAGAQLHTQESLLAGIDCLEKAIAIDPNFADAYGFLSYCHFQTWFLMGPDFDDSFARANELAEKGVDLDQDSASARANLGWVQTFLRRYDQAIANLEKAFALAPDDADVNATFGQVLNYWGDPERGLKMIDRAFGIETIPPPNWQFRAGLSRLLLHQYDEAVSRFLKAIEAAPKWQPPRLHLASAYAELGRIEDARDAIKTVLDIVPRYTIREAARQYPWRIDEVRNHIFDSFRNAGLPE